jgi:glycosyltransferase involved in cell wall biosynthesis
LLKIAIIYPETLPSDKARTVTVVKTAASLGEIAKVTLICEDSAADIDDICSHYGVQKSFWLEKLSKKALFFKSNKIFNFALARHLQKNSYDVLYVRHLKTAKALIDKGFKVVFEAHEIFSESASGKKAKKLFKTEKYVYENAVGIVFISKTLQDEFFAKFGELKSVVLPLSLTIRSEAATKKSFENVQEVYYIGSFQSWKGVDTLIKSAQYLTDGATIKLVGSGADEAKLKELVAKLGVNDKVEFLGRVTHLEVKELLETKSKICVLPNNVSVFDRFTSPLKLFEYMATFNAIVASDIASIKEITGDDVLIFAAGDEKELADKLNFLLANHSAAKEFAQKAYDKIKLFEPKERSYKLFDFLKEV